MLLYASNTVLYRAVHQISIQSPKPKETVTENVLHIFQRDEYLLKDNETQAITKKAMMKRQMYPAKSAENGKDVVRVPA